MDLQIYSYVEVKNNLLSLKYMPFKDDAPSVFLAFLLF